MHVASFVHSNGSSLFTIIHWPWSMKQRLLVLIQVIPINHHQVSVNYFCYHHWTIIKINQVIDQPEITQCLILQLPAFNTSCHMPWCHFDGKISSCEKKDHPWYVLRNFQRCSFFHTCHGATSKVLDTGCMDWMHSVRYLFKASKTVCNPGLLFTWCTARTLRLSIESCTAARPWRRSCFFVTAAKDSAALSPPTTRNPNRSSRAQPCFTKKIEFSLDQTFLWDHRQRSEQVLDVTHSFEWRDFGERRRRLQCWRSICCCKVQTLPKFLAHWQHSLSKVRDKVICYMSIGRRNPQTNMGTYIYI